MANLEHGRDVESDDPTGPWVLLGLDGEMSSADIESGGKLIQAGAAAWSGEPGGPVEVFSTLIQHDQMQWDPRAARVHGISQEDLASAPTPAQADEALREWLLTHGGVEGRRLLVPVGLNVAAFDMPFFRQALPRSSSLFARRAVDLNALCFSYASWDPNPRTSAPRDFAGWKRSMKAAANEQLDRAGVGGGEHDAGFDAAQALVGWWWLRQQTVDVTRKLAEAQDALEVADPLVSVLGQGLRRRLSVVSDADLKVLLESIPAGISPRKWFGTFHPGLGDTPLGAVEKGALEGVMSVAQLVG